MVAPAQVILLMMRMVAPEQLALQAAQEVVVAEPVAHIQDMLEV